METAALVAIFTALFVAITLSGAQWKAAEAKARARRTAEHRMNARLVRFDL